MRLSTVILAKNEETNIERAVKSASFSDEIIVIDDYSEDETSKIAKNLGTIVVERKIENDFSVQRNFGLQKSRGEWVLFLDADEEITFDLSIEIKKTMSEDVKKDAYYIKRRDFWWGKELRYGETRNVRQKGLIRLVKRNSGRWTRPVHEIFQPTGSVGSLNSFINHYPHFDLKEFLREINFYSSLRARELLANKKNTNLLEVILYPFGKFFNNYFIKRGYLDGPAGFTYAFMMSFHSFLVRSKLYQYKNID